MCCSRSAQLVIASRWESTCFSICKSLLPERLPLPWFRLAITASNSYTLYIYTPKTLKAGIQRMPEAIRGRYDPEDIEIHTLGLNGCGLESY